MLPPPPPGRGSRRQQAPLIALDDSPTAYLRQQQNQQVAGLKSNLQHSSSLRDLAQVSATAVDIGAPGINSQNLSTSGLSRSGRQHVSIESLDRIGKKKPESRHTDFVREFKAVLPKDIADSSQDKTEEEELLTLRESYLADLLQQQESTFISKETIIIHCATFNSNGQSPPLDRSTLWSWLQSDAENAQITPDILAIGFQELDNSKQAYVWTESSKESEWVSVLLDVVRDVYTDTTYHLVRVVRLVGIMLVLLVRKSLTQYVRNISTVTVGCGLLGIMGNKGGVAIRCDVHSTSICFVSAHLSAHMLEGERRNQDYREISSRLIFRVHQSDIAGAVPVIPELSLDDHDVVFWLGDLNYRIVNIDINDVKRQIQFGELVSLYKLHDQLKEQMSIGRTFRGYEEDDIGFWPTYKYDAGTERQWDSSEKMRIPAWCDRILWRCADPSCVKPLGNTYKSHMQVTISDHKPVSNVFRTTIRIIDEPKKRRVLEQIMRDVDKLENENRPQIKPSQLEIDFGDVKFLEPKSFIVSLDNIGGVPASFVFKDTPHHPNAPSASWLEVRPKQGMIPRRGKIDLELTANVSQKSVGRIATDPARQLQDFLVMHLVGGRDLFFTISGKLAPTCFGLPLPVLLKMPSFSKSLSIDMEVLATIFNTAAAMMNNYHGKVPRQVYRLVDRLISDGLNSKELFQVQGSDTEKFLIRNALDSNNDNPLPGSIPTVAETLLIFIQSLPQSLIPPRFYRPCMDAAHRVELCYGVVQSLPEESQNLVLYLLKFMGEVLKHGSRNGLNLHFLSSLLVDVFFYQPPDFVPDDKIPMLTSHHHRQNAITFIGRLLARELGQSLEDMNASTSRC